MRRILVHLSACWPLFLLGCTPLVDPTPADDGGSSDSASDGASDAVSDVVGPLADSGAPDSPDSSPDATPSDAGPAVDAAVNGVLVLRAGTLGGIGRADGTGAAARFNNPNGVAVDGAGNVFVGDSFNETIRKITSAGVVTTIAGKAGVRGSADGTGSAAHFDLPTGVAVDSAGNVFVADSQNSTIRKITSAGVVTTLAGTAGTLGAVDGTGAAASFSQPYGVAVDGSGNLYVADTTDMTIRKITSGGVVTTIAGAFNAIGSADGTGAAASFYYPYSITADATGNLFVADTFNDTIREIAPGNVVTTLAGTVKSTGARDTYPIQFFNPYGLAVDGADNVFVADTLNNTVRKVTAAGVVTTFAGNPVAQGTADGNGLAARFSNPHAIAVDGADNVFVADTTNATIRKITAAGDVTTFAGSPFTYGSADGTGAAATFNQPAAAAVDGAGNAFVVDSSNHTIRKVTPAGVVTTFAGMVGSPGIADGTGTAAQFNQPTGIAVDAAGNLFVADWGSHTIRKITSAGVVTTFAGTPYVHGHADGSGSAATFYNPHGVAVDGSGNVFVADTHNFEIRKITSAGAVTTLAGTAAVQGSLDGIGPTANFVAPYAVAVDVAGKVFVADFGDSTIRVITPAGLVTRLAGVPGVEGSNDGVGTAAHFSIPTGLAVDGVGNLYVLDTGNLTIRKIVLASGLVTTIAGVPGQMGVELGPLPAQLSFANADSNGIYLGWGIATTPGNNLVITAENSVLDIIFQ